MDATFTLDKIGLPFINKTDKDDITNYFTEQSILLEIISKFIPNEATGLTYAVTCLIHDGIENPEFHLQVTIPYGKASNIILPIITKPGENPDFYVNWGDTIHPEYGSAIHSYPICAVTKTYNIRFFGLNIIGFGKQTSIIDDFQKYLTSVKSFGNLGHTFTSLSYAFAWCVNDITLPEYLPDSVTDLSYMFYCCYNFNQSLNRWNTSKITNMEGMFYWCLNFNKSLNNWDTSNVSNMSMMFYRCMCFRQSLRNWDISNVANFRKIFLACINFDDSCAKNYWIIPTSAIMDYTSFCYKG